VPELKGDLEMILMKALRTEPQDRYSSVEAFADDLRAYLECRPVQARSGDVGYRIRKLLRHYWKPTAAAAVVIVSLFSGLHLRREIRAIPLETTALVHEAFLKLAAGRHPSYENRAHFYGIASRLMRQVLVDTARAKTAEKRAAAQEVPISDMHDYGSRPDRSLLILEDALQWLERSDPRKARLIEMRFFAGMTAEETSTALRIPVHIVRRELRLAQALLRQQMACVCCLPSLPRWLGRKNILG
jgi:RNA polymerase sigma factor (TIGR02999 family)